MSEKQKAYTFLAIAGAILMGVGMILATLILMSSQVTYEKVKCYDRWQNEIIGQTCLEEHKIYDRILSLPIVMTFAGFTWVIISLHALQNEFDRLSSIDLNNRERRY